tara:strand:+ start:14080 stop:14184 length:105 start_codon:yes stop_codon:yes gene_type:complete
MMKSIIAKLWQFFTQDEGMTWETYHRNMERRKKK